MSDGNGILEYMFDGAARAEVIARFDELMERQYPSVTGESAALVDEVCVAARAENRAAAAQLDAIGRLFGYRLSRCSETEDWAIDTMEAVAAEVAAALRIGQGLAASRVRYARAMRKRLPKVAEVFLAGDIDFRLFATIVYRTDLITDEQVLAAVDAELAVKVPRWPSMSRGRLSGQVDKIVAKLDADAVRWRQQRQSDREVWFADDGEGVSQIGGSLFTADAHALDKRLEALAATVCQHDPRSREQRRADALGALAAGADRLGCRCRRPDCAAGRRPASAVVIHVIAEQATLDGRGDAPGSLVGVDELITPELIKELSASAKLVPLVHPGDAAPEPGYRPSKALADFVRCRDLTCRWPGCDRPAWGCELDHTIPYSQGGLTHAANLKCYCKTQQLSNTLRDHGAHVNLKSIYERAWSVPSERSHRRLVDSAHVLGNDCGTVPTQVGHHLHGRTTCSIIRTVGQPRHMYDPVRDGQIGHDFTAVGEVAEIDSTQPPGPVLAELRARRVELHSLRPRNVNGVAVGDHHGVASASRQVAKRHLVGAGVVVQRDPDVSGMPLLWRQVPVSQLAWIVLAQRRHGRALQVFERDCAAAGRGIGVGHRCCVRKGGQRDGRQKANPLDGPGLTQHPPARSCGHVVALSGHGSLAVPACDGRSCTEFRRRLA